MNNVVKISLLFILLAFASCYEKEVFSDVPKVEFNDIIFYDGEFIDSLVLSFDFENGGGDFGINSELDFFPPFNQFDLFLDQNNNVINEESYSSVELPIYKVPVVFENVRILYIDNELRWDLGDSFAVLGPSRDTLESLNELPIFECPNLANQSNTLDTINFKLYDLIDDRIEVNDVQVNGLLLVHRVDTYYNFHIEFYEKKNGNFEILNFNEKFNVDELDCEFGNFSGQIPIFDVDGESGKITYNMKSVRFKPAFLDNEIRIKFWIYDRKLNKSNEVTHDFTLGEITTL